MPHRRWWPQAQQVVHLKGSVSTEAVAACTDTLDSLSLPAHKASRSVADKETSQPSTACSINTSPHSSTSNTDEGDADALDWQATLLQKILPCPKSAEPEQQTNITASCTQQHMPSGLHQPQPLVSSQDSDTPLAQQHHSRRSDGKPQPQAASSALQPDQYTSTASKAIKAQPPVLHYAAVFLDPLSRAKLLAWAQPMHSCLSADHMTLLFRPSLADAKQLPLGTTEELTVLAKMHDAVTQVRLPAGMQQRVTDSCRLPFPT